MPHRVLTLATALCIAAAFSKQLPAQQPAPIAPGPETVTYTPKFGTVTFTHAKHAKASECTACHHESRPEHPYTAPQQKCGTCHVAEPVAPMVTNLRNAFHHTAAKTGVCFDCHNKEAAAGKTVPATCTDCHKQ